MNKASMPFTKGRKLWIEIEAFEDGDLTSEKNEELIKKIYADGKIGQFNINSLILFRSYFNQNLQQDLKQNIDDFFNKENSSI